jgi:hypothetical protein
MEQPKKQVMDIYEQDLADGHYRIVWKGTDPITWPVSELRNLEKLIEDWAEGKVPDKMIALRGSTVLRYVSDHLEAVDEELTGRRRNE